ncbi:MAG: hypothetical protein B7Y05_06380 [Polynucleobacter sp. 24-46-87]|jgi:uncharacterized phage-associated protein|uniref:Panacea domain-containing protein n=1 Tax=unclassified Polynucleobacter TaxID=2640945 RepID=UPI000BD143BC|nr:MULTISPECIES: Panacea domain-containing protein [unclassified Polynucleobacter]OYY18282.1 MAG: hypothetical protein B7Y67_06985 [Polynucleobacter sp. 35-46-11]OZA14760.1 MAG: hypothetical protein B7Y05_06380 [Polynucleobacter sp. 24-46-87]OZA76411.1 MAG: hypothetical protein B7X71_08530 [Polynucleobacter sp. 39-46-10]QWE22603.1 SocA family protein [Polynucleobacter sp. AP-Jannik-300A-C4]
MFNERKVAQMATFFLRKESNARMSHLKLMKLLYLSDREAIKSFGMPISGDLYVSMPHGPVLSKTLNLMDGDIESQDGGWESWISDKENHEVAVRSSVAHRELDELSRAELEVLEIVWGNFGGMDKWTIRDWTHINCPEWHDPNGSSYSLEFDDIVKALEKSKKFDKETAAQIIVSHKSAQDIDNLFASI